MSTSRTRIAELVAAHALSPSVRSLTFALEDRQPLRYVAGQHVNVLTKTASGMVFRRDYSIASKPGAAPPERFEIAVTKVEGGPTCTALHEAPIGAGNEVRGTKGNLPRAGGSEEMPSFFGATGTGLAPIRAML